MKNTFRYLFIPAISLLFTVMIYNWINATFLHKNVVETSEQSKNSGEVLIGGPFTLTNQNGQIVSDKNFIGKLMLVYFGFSNCPMVCPTDMANMTTALGKLNEAEVGQVQPIFITIDPERDTVEQLKAFSENFFPGLQALTGTPEQIAEVANSYKIYYKKAEAENLGEYLMEHSAYMYLMGRDGKYVTHFRHDQDPDEIAAGLRKHL